MLGLFIYNISKFPKAFCYGSLIGIASELGGIEDMSMLDYLLVGTIIEGVQDILLLRGGFEEKIKIGPSETKINLTYSKYQFEFYTKNPLADDGGKIAGYASGIALGRILTKYLKTQF